jgi:hypothetical protein
MDKDEALKLALEALRSAAAELYRASSYCNTYEVIGNTNDAITAIQKARSAPVQEPVRWSDYEPDGRRYPAVPDAFGTREGEHPQYIQGWNDCRSEMLKGMKP